MNPSDHVVENSEANDSMQREVLDNASNTGLSIDSSHKNEDNYEYILNELLDDKEKIDLAIKLTRDTFPHLPDSLVIMLVSMMIPGDLESDRDKIPEWLDHEKFARGQRFACENLFGIFFAEMLSLYALFSFEDGLKPMIITQKSSDPYTAFKRYLSTGNRVRNWYTSDPWTKGTHAYNDIRRVRQMHTNVRSKLDNLSNTDMDKLGKIEKPWCPTRKILLDDFQSSCPVPKPGQCPYFIEDVRRLRPKGLNQGEMACTQLGFINLAILYPQAFGIHSETDEDLEAFCHVWRGIGYLLGMEDEYNFCRGSLEDIRHRSREFIDFWVKPNFRRITPEWEHMLRCVTEGLEYYFPGASYETSLLYFTELIDVDMPRLRASLSYKNWIQLNSAKLILRYGCKSPKLKQIFNKNLNKCINRALEFPEEKHVELRERSLKTMNIALNNEKYSASMLMNSESMWGKLFSIFIVLVPGLILWRVNLFSGKH